MPPERDQLLRPELGKRFAENLDPACGGMIETEHLTQQGGLPGPGAAHDAQDFPLYDRQLEIAVHDVLPKSSGDPTQLDDSRLRGIHGHMPTCENSTAKMASATSTLLIATTTELVVPAPRLSVLGFTRSPKWHATKAMITPNTTPLPSPIQ